MSWTTPVDLKRQVQRLWDGRKLLAALVNDEPIFPYRLTLKSPAPGELAAEFPAVRQWLDGLRKGEGKGYRIVWREVNHRIVGRNSLPNEIWVDSLDDALTLIGKRAEADTFKALVSETRARCPSLQPWLTRQPLRALELAGDWSRLLDVIDWLRVHPRPGIYLRQIDVPGVHTKFIESHRGVLSELLDLALPEESIDSFATGGMNFCCRYGFRDKPLRIRFRILDSRWALIPNAAEQDITLTHEGFAGLEPPLRRVFITENETNFLAFPQCPDSLVVFGAGYGFEMLERAQWLHDREVYYWGDIDTHGFAILDQLRALLPHVQSFLMDTDTLHGHRTQWGIERQSETRDLVRLTSAERALYDALRYDRFGHQLRLEQERVGFSWVQRALGLLA